MTENGSKTAAYAACEGSTESCQFIGEKDKEMNMEKFKYLKNGDYFIPNLALKELPQQILGKYGRMRKTYLQEHRPALYSHLLLSEKLYPHLLEIDRAANDRLESLMPTIIKAAGITEQLKTTDQMRWVGLMSAVKAQVDEIIFAELVYR